MAQSFLEMPPFFFFFVTDCPYFLSFVRSGTDEEMGAKPSLAETTGPVSGLVPAPTYENIEAVYEGGDEEAAGELIQQACCAECSAGICPDRVSLLVYWSHVARVGWYWTVKSMW